MSQKKRPTLIEMPERPNLLDSDRGMMQKFIINDQDSPENIVKAPVKKSTGNGQNKQRTMDERELNKMRRLQKNRNKRIFDGDFQVQQMSNPVNHLIKYAQRMNMNTNINQNYNQNLSQNQSRDPNNPYYDPNAIPLRNLRNNRNLNINYLNTDPAVGDISHCCGQIAICLGSCFSFCCMKCCVYELQTSSAGLVQRFGRFTRLLKPGFNHINPCSQQVFEIDMKIRLINTGQNVTLTRDNIRLTIESCVAFRVANPVLAYYVLGSELNKSILDLAIFSFRRVIAQNDLQQILQKKQKFNNEVLKEMNKVGIPGVHFQNAFLEDFVLPNDISRDLSAVARAKRIAQANLIETKADVQSAQLMRQTSQLLDTKAAMQIRYLQLVQQIGRGGSSLVMDIGAYKGQKTYY